MSLLNSITEIESQTSCSAITEQCCPPNGFSCGIRYPPVAGSGSAPGRTVYGSYPWQALLLTKDGEYIGSAVLISQWHLLTVADRAKQFE